MAGAPGSNVLALNSGSSSLKFGMYRVRSVGTETLLSGKWAIGETGNAFHARDSSGKELAFEASPNSNQQEAMDRIAKLLAESGMPKPDAIGHRIVHGGPKLRQHCLIDEEVMGKLEAATAF